MNSLFGRYFAAVIGFGFVAVWAGVGAVAALLCLVASAAFFYGSAVLQRRRVDTFTNRFAERSRTLQSLPARTPTRTPDRQLRRSPDHRAERRARLSEAASSEPLAAFGDYGW